MLHAGKEVVTFHRPADSISHDFAHYVCRTHAMPGVTLAVVDVLVDAANDRDSVQDDADLATPIRNRLAHP